MPGLTDRNEEQRRRDRLNRAYIKWMSEVHDTCARCYRQMHGNGNIVDGRQTCDCCVAVLMSEEK